MINYDGINEIEKKTEIRMAEYIKLRKESKKLRNERDQKIELLRQQIDNINDEYRSKITKIEKKEDEYILLMREDMQLKAKCDICNKEFVFMDYTYMEVEGIGNCTKYYIKKCRYPKNKKLVCRIRSCYNNVCGCGDVTTCDKGISCAILENIGSYCGSAKKYCNIHCIKVVEDYESGKISLSKKQLDEIYGQEGEYAKQFAPETEEYNKTKANFEDKTKQLENVKGLDDE